MNDNERMEYLYEVFDASLPRLGPGDDRATERALSILLEAKAAGERRATHDVDIIDLGCGTGASTIVLAKNTDSRILAVDNHESFLDELRGRAEAAGVSERIETRLADMHDLGAEIGRFDIVWSEGAIYVVGFHEGLMRCRDLLKPNGMCAFTELTWLKPEPPAECREFFAQEYAPMTDIKTNIADIEDCGYELLYQFTLPDSAWWEPYYLPLERRLELLRQKSPRDTDRLEVIGSIQSEIDICRKHQEYYGYVFYLMRS